MNYSTEKDDYLMTTPYTKKIQQKFEDNVKAALNEGVNPFELNYEGELDKQR